jgi:hypothetical protein
MPNLTDELLSQLQGAPLQRISQQLGVEPQAANQAVGAALPLLLGTLGRNASQPDGAQSLFGALQRDHGGMDLGSVLGAVLGGNPGGRGGNLDESLGGADAGGGANAGTSGSVDGMLGHIFGDRTQRAEEGLGQATGLGSNNAHQLLQMLAPIVMTFLAQRFAGGRADPGGLQQALGQEREQIKQQEGLGGGLLNAVLDRDGDGQVDFGDLLKAGAGMLGGRR